MAKRVVRPVAFVIVGFCREHMPAVFRDQISLFRIGSDRLFRFTAGIPAAVAEIIIGINIIEKMAPLAVPHAAGAAAVIQFMSHPVRLLIEAVAVRTFIDPDPPQDD